MRRAIDSALSLPMTPHMPRGVVYECANYPDKPWQGGTFAGCNVWRVSADVPDSFDGWTSVVDQAVREQVNQRAGKLGAGRGDLQQWGGGWSSFDYLRIQTGPAGVWQPTDGAGSGGGKYDSSTPRAVVDAVGA